MVSTETAERLATFLSLATAYASLGDAIGSQLRSWAGHDFDSEAGPTAGAREWIADRLGSRVAELAELLDADEDELASILQGERS